MAWLSCFNCFRFQFFNDHDEFARRYRGPTRSGKIANLIVLDENPLLDIRHTRTIDRVILKGRLIDPDVNVESAAKEE